MTATPSEVEALREMLVGCAEPVTLDITRVEQAKPPIAVEPTPLGVGAAPAGMDAEDSGDLVEDGCELLYAPRGQIATAGTLRRRNKRRRSLRWRVGWI